MDLISERDLTKEQVVSISRDLLRQAYGSLEQNREQVAAKIYEGITDDRILGECPKCGKNKLRVVRSKTTKKRFVGCEGYPECDQTYPLPQRGDIIGTGEICPQCGSPKIKVLGGRRPWVLCLDPYCPTKAEYREKRAAREAAAGTTRAVRAKTGAKSGATRKKGTKNPGSSGRKGSATAASDETAAPDETGTSGKTAAKRKTVATPSASSGSEEQA